jgi:hypothetical protein
MGWLILDERIGFSLVVGAVPIMTGFLIIILVQSKEAKRKRLEEFRRQLEAEEIGSEIELKDVPSSNMLIEGVEVEGRESDEERLPIEDDRTSYDQINQ